MTAKSLGFHSTNPSQSRMIAFVMTTTRGIHPLDHYLPIVGYAPQSRPMRDRDIMFLTSYPPFSLIFLRTYNIISTTSTIALPSKLQGRFLALRRM